MLDPYMQYFLAPTGKMPIRWKRQQAKLKLICEKLQLQPGMRVLDIGCGWAGLCAIYGDPLWRYVVGVNDLPLNNKMARRRVAKV